MTLIRPPSESEDESHPSKQRKKKNDAKIAVLKAQLKELMSQPLLSRGVSARYITSGSRPIADDIISGNGRSSGMRVFPLELTASYNMEFMKLCWASRNRNPEMT